MKLRIGFIGVGAMGLSHLKAMHQDHAGEAEAVAICAGNGTNIRNALALAPKAAVFARAQDLTASDLDAVFVSTPNFLHARQGLEVLRAGKHLFLEKPVGITRDECAQLLDAEARSGKVVMIGHELRCSPYFGKVKALIQAGEIGRPCMVWTREWRGPLQKKSRDWIQDNRRSGGTLLEKNCHHFDLMNWWAGSRPKRVCAFGGRVMNRAARGRLQGLDHAAASFEYENGVRGSLQLCLFARDFPREDLEMGVIGDAGMLQTRLPTLEILHRRRGSGRSDSVALPVNCQSGSGWGGHLGFDEIHRAFLRAVLDGQPPPTSARECLDGSLLGIAAGESIRCGQAVDVRRKIQDPARDSSKTDRGTIKKSRRAP